MTLWPQPALCFPSPSLRSTGPFRCIYDEDNIHSYTLGGFVSFHQTNFQHQTSGQKQTNWPTTQQQRPEGRMSASEQAMASHVENAKNVKNAAEANSYDSDDLAFSVTEDDTSLVGTLAESSIPHQL